MKVLIIGGTGNISTAISRQLLNSGGVQLFHFNRGNAPAQEGVTTLVGDRRDFAAFEEKVRAAGEFDCVIDMIGFLPEEASHAVRVFKGRTRHYIYCSTVDVYTKQAAYYPIDEQHPRLVLPSFPYAYNKMKSENILMEAHGDQFPVTIFRPAQTYGGMGFAVASVGDGRYQMRRLREGRPILIHGDGTSIWTAWMTYNRYWLTVAEALGAPNPRLVHIPTDLLGRALPRRAEWCVENFSHNNMFDNSAAKDDLDFRYTVKWRDGIADVISQLDEHGLIDNAEEEPWYDRVVEQWEQAAGAWAEAIRSCDGP